MKITIFWPKLRKNGVPVGHAQKKKHFFFWEITKADPKLSKPFYFKKISYVLSYECFSMLCDTFLLKSVMSSAVKKIVIKNQIHMHLNLTNPNNKDYSGYPRFSFSNIDSHVAVIWVLRANQIKWIFVCPSFNIQKVK